MARYLPTKMDTASGLSDEESTVNPDGKTLFSYQEIYLTAIPYKSGRAVGITALIVIIAIIAFLIKVFAGIFVGLIILVIIIGVGFWIYTRLKSR